MKFDDLDREMRIYEQSVDQSILSDLYLVTRLDGRSFTRLTKEICKFEAPFDERFRDCMTETSKHLLNCGFQVIYAYTESDEISLLFHPGENGFGRKTRKLNSILAGEASACASLILGCPAVFDCRVVPLPTLERVKDYFLWRQEDAHRNSLNAHCYWLLRKNGATETEATKALEGKSVSYKNETLFSYGINYNDLPPWQKRGIGLYWQNYEKTGYNPITQTNETASRRKITVDMELPLGRDYESFITGLVESCL